jgi:mutual gliding-motility protein MglA
MIEYDDRENKMVLKLVYYGPALSGKTTNLMSLHDMLDPEGRGGLMMLDTRDDRTIFFDLLPLFIEAPSGLKIKVKLYTVPGQVKHDATRKAVLQRCDGVAFIADSRVSESKNNEESFSNLEKNLGLTGLNIEELPLVIQYNKRDLTDITPEYVIKKVWGATSFPVLMASAIHHTGVIETLSTLLSRTYDHIDHRHSLSGRHGLDRDTFLNRLIKKIAQ